MEQTLIAGKAMYHYGMMANNESVVKLLANNVPPYLTARGPICVPRHRAEQLGFTQKIIHHGGDVTLPNSNRSTIALRVAVCEGNAEIVKFLVDQGADIDKPDGHGWSPRALADQQGHDEIKLLFQSTEEVKTQTPIGSGLTSGFFALERRRETRFLGRFTSEPTIQLMGPGLASPVVTRSVGQSRLRRRSNSFHNSLFGIMSAAHGRDNNKLLLSRHETQCGESVRDYPTRVTISFPQKGKGSVMGKLVLLPQSFQELLEIGTKNFRFLPTKILTKDGAEIDDIKLIRDGDRIVFVSDGGLEEAHSENIES